MIRKSIVGVSVTPEIGLEVAQIDFASQTVLKYGYRQLEYDLARREILDLDVFKETLQDLFIELQIPAGTEVVVNIPTVAFNVSDYPASLDGVQIEGAIEEELNEHFILKSVEPAISATRLPNSSMQFYKIAYTAAQKQMLIEIAMGIRDIGYKVATIDTSVNSVLNALMYKQRVDVSPDMSWVLMIVETNCCRILTMNGKDFVDVFEEKLAIGQVLDDAENYGTVINAVSPILKNLPSKYLCVVSKTNVISAEALASKLTYSAPIIHQEANCYSKEALLDLAPSVDEKAASLISLDVIGAAINTNFAPYSDIHFNLFNKSLGEVYTIEQPPELQLGSRTIVLSNEFLTGIGIFLALIIGGIAAALFVYFNVRTLDAQSRLDRLDTQKTQIEQYLKANEDVSSDLFNEGEEIKLGLTRNKGVYSYYTIVGTEIPKKLWLTHLKFGDKTTIEGQADNLESVYAFFRSIKDYDPSSAIKLQKLGLAAKSNSSVLTEINGSGGAEFDADSILTSLNADFYEFVISDETPVKKGGKKNSDPLSNAMPALEPINESN